MMPLNQHATPHDALFKKALQHTQVACQLLKRYLPSVLFEMILLDTLTMENVEFVGDGLQKMACDVLFVCKAQAGHVYFLLEHQRKADPRLPLRILKYAVCLIERHLKIYQTHVPPLVFPLVVYNGKNPFPESTDLFDFICPRFYGQAIQVPRIDYALLDLNCDDISMVNDDIYLAPLLYVLRDGPSKKPINQLVDEISPFLIHLDEAGENEYIKDILCYLLEVRDKSHRDELMQALMRKLKPTCGDKTMISIADALRNEGLKKGLLLGREEGHQEGRQEEQEAMIKKMLLAGISKNQVASIAGLSLEEINTMALLLNKEVMSS